MTTYADRISAIVARHPDHPGAVELLQIAAEMRVERLPAAVLVPVGRSAMLEHVRKLEQAKADGTDPRSVVTYAVPAAYSAPPKPATGQRWASDIVSNDIVTLKERIRCVDSRTAVAFDWTIEESDALVHEQRDGILCRVFVDHGPVAPHEASGSLL